MPSYSSAMLQVQDSDASLNNRAMRGSYAPALRVSEEKAKTIANVTEHLHLQHVSSICDPRSLILFLTTVKGLGFRTFLLRHRLTLGFTATKRVYGSWVIKAEHRRTLNFRGTMVPPRWKTGIWKTIN